MSGEKLSGLKPAVNMGPPDGGGAVDGMREVGRLLGGTLVTGVAVEPLPVGGAAVEVRTEFPISATSSNTLLNASSICVASSLSWLLQVVVVDMDSAQLEQERKHTVIVSVLKIFMKCDMVNIAAVSL